MTNTPHTPDSEKERSLSLEEQQVADDFAGKPRWYRLYFNSWSQITLVSVICFFLPGMYNAISGLGGSGQLDPTIGANASVALLSVGAATGLLMGQPMFDIFGVRCIIMGGWTYAFYTGSLLNYNHRGNGAFVIAAGAILGGGATLLWITQGAIMLSYPLPHQKGRSIAFFWMICEFWSVSGLPFDSRLRSQPGRRHRLVHLAGHQLQPHQGRDGLGLDLCGVHGSHARRLGPLLLPCSPAPRPPHRRLARRPSAGQEGGQVVRQLLQEGQGRDQAHYPAQGRAPHPVPPPHVLCRQL
jgi:hypothetical protein